MILVTGSNGVLGAAFKNIKNKQFHFLNTRKDLDLCSQEESQKFFDNNKFEGKFILQQFQEVSAYQDRSIRQRFLEIIQLCYLIY